MKNWKTNNHQKLDVFYFGILAYLAQDDSDHDETVVHNSPDMQLLNQALLLMWWAGRRNFKTPHRGWFLSKTSVVHTYIFASNF